MIRKIVLFTFIYSVFFNPILLGKNKNQQDREILAHVAQWQIDHHYKSRHHNLDWTNGALYVGMIELANFTEDQQYFDFLTEIGNRNRWDLLDRIYHADDLTVGQMYVKMYQKFKDPKMIKITKDRLDYIVDNPSKARLWLGAEKWSERWSWCDALFMAPPVYAAMYNIHSEDKYLDFMDREFKECVDSLYDQKDHLFYRDRRFIGKKEKNGEKVFWGRGNGWVFAGIPLLLRELPKSHSTYNYYLNIYKDMAEVLVKVQDAEGSWHASLLDQESYPMPENSASGFIVYGLAWGVNNGILKDNKYKEAALRGWSALKSHVNEDGKLGYVQPVSADPGKVTEEMTEVYGVGAFLLAGIEILRMSGK